METRRIGTLQVSLVGLGCNNFGWRLDAAQTSEVVHAALDAGINFFDTADIYGRTHSEEFLGRALGHRRSEVIIPTKFGMAVDEKRRGARPDYVLQAAEDSLRRLGTDRIDLYQIHQPDETLPIADTLAEKNLDLVEALIQFAESKGHTLLELAISWLAARPTVASVIAGATTSQQVKMNAAAAGWRLSKADLTEVDKILH